MYFHQKSNTQKRPDYTPTFDDWINDSLYPNCTVDIENWPFTPKMDSSSFERFVPLITEDYMNSLKLLFTIMGYPQFDPPDSQKNSYESHEKNGNRAEKQYISYEVMKRFQVCKKTQYEEYFNAVHLYYQWKELVFGSTV